MCSDPPDVDPVNFGYSRHEPSKSLLPVTVPADVPLAPDQIMKLINVAVRDQVHAEHRDVVAVASNYLALCFASVMLEVNV